MAKVHLIHDSEHDRMEKEEEMTDTGVPNRTIEVSVPEDLLKRLDERAKKIGSNRSQMIRELIARELDRPQETPLKRSSLDETLTRIRLGFSESGLSEEEAMEIFERELEVVRAHQRAKRADDGEI